MRREALKQHFSDRAETVKRHGQKVKQKGKKVAGRLLFSRTMITILFLVLQLLFLLAAFRKIQLTPTLLGFSYFFSALSIIYIVNGEENPAFKLAWAVTICALPVFGITLYMLVLLNPGNRGQKRLLDKRIEETRKYLKTQRRVVDKMKKETLPIRNLGYYIQRENFFPSYDHTDVQFLGLGEEKYEKLKEDLINAERYIFLEYFIITPGQVWDTILEILKEKAAQGVEVRVLYDGLMSAFTLPFDYPKRLAEFGIKAKKFSPIMPFLSTSQNSRDHRKIAVIDGCISYTGGINLADEYMNLIRRFGHWKDTAVRLDGEATRSFVLMFLQLWNLDEKAEERYSRYLLPRDFYDGGEGYVIPFNDDPTNRRDIAQNVYLNLIYCAQRSVHIMTPYLIIDHEMTNALCFAAQRGVEVQIIMPHIPDKAVIFAIGRTYYPQLLAAGVQIYEYKPGFVHAKEIITDGILAVEGTINMDFRSFYHHFECGVLICRNSVIGQMEQDFEETVKKSIRINDSFYFKLPLMYRLVARVCRLFGPLV